MHEAQSPVPWVRQRTQRGGKMRASRDARSEVGAGSECINVMVENSESDHFEALRVVLPGGFLSWVQVLPRPPVVSERWDSSTK